MGFDFLGRVTRTSIVTGLVLFPVIATHLGLAPGAAWLVGCLWSLVNIFFIGLLVKTTWAGRRRQRLRITWICLVKVPVLYGIGFLLVWDGHLPLMGLLAGFMWPLLVIVLKALGRLVLGLDRTSPFAPRAGSIVVGKDPSR